MYDLISVGKKSKDASYELLNLKSDQKSKALLAIADELIKNTDEILTENQKDLEELLKNEAKANFYDRLKLTRERIEQMAEGVKQVDLLPDPVGEIIETLTRPNGLKISKNTPEFYETCLKLLKTDKESYITNYIKSNFKVEVHLSTQASCVNSEAVKMYKNLGFKRIVLGREVSLDEIKRIKEVERLNEEIIHRNEW